MVGSGPRKPKDVGKETLGNAVAPYNFRCKNVALIGQHDLCATQTNQTFGFHPLDHFRHRRARDAQPIGNACLNDIKIVFVQFENAFAIFLERWMVFAGVCHTRKATPLMPRA